MKKREFMELVAGRAGDIMEKRQNKLRVEHKTDNTPVTSVDIEINKYVAQQVHEHYPEDNVLGEELSVEKTDARGTWVVDPIDGTQPYISGLTLSTFVLAYVTNGEVTHGIIHNPFLRRTYYADTDTATERNGYQIRVNQADTVNQQVFGYEAEHTSPHPVIETRKELVENGARIMQFMSSNYTAALVAEGRFGGLLFAGDTPHDGAAVKIIVEQAGGKVTSLTGKQQRYDEPLSGYLATNGKLHGQILNSLTKQIKLKN